MLFTYYSRTSTSIIPKTYTLCISQLNILTYIYHVFFKTYIYHVFFESYIYHVFFKTYIYHVFFKTYIYHVFFKTYIITCYFTQTCICKWTMMRFRNSNSEILKVLSLISLITLSDISLLLFQSPQRHSFSMMTRIKNFFQMTMCNISEFLMCPLLLNHGD